MNADYIQNLRYKLQKRVRRLNSTSNHDLFHYALKQFWSFLNDYPVFVGIIEDLQRRSPASEVDADQIINSIGRVFDSEIESAAASCFVIKKCVEYTNTQAEIKVGMGYGNSGKISDSLDLFKSLFLEPLYEYIDEQLDDQKAILALLRRYKHKCEWFQREQLFSLWTADTSRGEKQLALHLYEYLHDQGLDFTIEASSASGEADLVAAQKSDYPLIADTKIFNPEKGKAHEYIAKGFNQIYIYTLDYNEPFGYLIIYNTSGLDLRFALVNQEQTIPFVIHNNKTIFLITVDIYPYQLSASRRGPLKTVEITEESLVRIIETE